MDGRKDRDDLAVDARGMTKQFGALLAVDGIDLAVGKGELFSLLGPNGAGKTTTIKMLCCLVKPTAGTATILGHDVVENPFAVKEVIDVSPQETAVAGHLSAWENLLLMGGVYGLSKQETKARARELIELMGLTGRTAEQVRKFSGGMQRRLSIAMALVSDPQVLFLDEPTLGLDPQARRELWTHIEKFKGRKTILLTTHYLEEADALADRVAIIDAGRIVAQGTPSQLKERLYGMQTMLIRAKNLTSESMDGLKHRYPQATATENGVEIRARELIFDDIVDYLRSKGAKIEWLTMQEPTLDDVFLSLTGKKADK